MSKILQIRSAAHLPALIALTLFLLLPGSLWAAVGKTFEYTYEGKTLSYTVLNANTVETKKGQEYPAPAGNTVSGELILPEIVYDGDKAYTLVKISDNAFSGCTGLTSINIPNSVTSIGKNAFYLCTGLKTLKIEDGDKELSLSSDSFYYSFRSCYIESLYVGRNLSSWKGLRNSDSLTKAEIGNSVTSIGASAFDGCTGLTSVIIGNSVTTIDEKAFYGCTGLPSIDIPTSVTKIGESAFSGCTGLKTLKIEDGDKELSLYSDNSDYYQFKDCKIESLYVGRNLSSWKALCNSGSLTKAEIGNSVTIIGQQAFEGCYDLTSINIPNSVTSIGIYAFAGCSGLTSMTIPNSVTTIGESAFSRCSGLTSINIGNSVTFIGNSAFSRCSGLTSVTIPNSVTSIGNSAFSECTGLTSVIIGNSVNTIGESAFYGCTGLPSIDIPTSVTKIGKSAFSGCTGLKTLKIEDGDKELSLCSDNNYRYPFIDCKIESLYIGRNLSSWEALCNSASLTKAEIGNSVTTIGESAFNGCKGLTSVIIGNSVTTINEKAFYGCTGMASINIPNSVTSIGEDAFYGCYGLKTLKIEDGDKELSLYSDNNYFYPFKDCKIESLYVGRNLSSWRALCNSASLTKAEIGNSVTSIGEKAFDYCTGLTSITIPNSVTTIGKQAFEGCYYLTSINIPNSVSTIGEGVFSKCTGLTSINIPNSVTSIGFSAFSGCTGLTSINIPNSVTTIGNSAFSECTGLTSLNIPNSVTSIGESAFSGCTGLTSINIPNSVTTIGIRAFSGCTGLTWIIIPASVTTIGESAFSNCSGLVKLAYPSRLSEPSDYYGVAIAYPADDCVFEDVWIYNTNKSTVYFAPLDIKEVNLPNSVTTIGGGAFAGCTGLTSVTIPTLMNTIGERAFYKCNGIETLKIEDGDKELSLGSEVLAECKIKSLYVGRNLSSWQALCNSFSLTKAEIGNSVTSIGEKAFYNCTGLPSINIPNSVTSIGFSAFSGCSSLPSINIPNSVTSVDGSAFEGCYGLKTLKIEDSDKELSLYSQKIGNNNFYPFKKCKIESLYVGRNLSSWEALCNSGSLTKAEIGNSVTSIGENAFKDCFSLDTLKIEDGDKELSLYSENSNYHPFTGCYIKSLYEGRNLSSWEAICNAENVVIGNSVTSIGKNAFYKSSLISVIIGKSVTSIGENAFRLCKGLVKSAYPSSLSNPFSPYGKTIAYPANDCAFEDELIYNADKSLIYFAPLSLEGEYTLPNNIREIGAYAFYGCKLTSVTAQSTTVPMMNAEAFSGLYTTCTLTVPAGLFADYMTTSNWYLFKDINGSSTLDNGNFKYRVDPKAETPTAVLIGPAKEMTEITVLAKVSLDGKMHTVVGIGTNAFKGKKLTNVTFRNGIEYIGEGAFDGNLLTNFELPNSVKRIGNSAFANNSKLATVTLGEGVETIGDKAFATTALTSITIPDAVKTIGNSAFANNTKLASVTLGKGVETIGDYAFYKAAITALAIPDAVKTIGNYAFANNTKLAAVTLGEGVETIGDYAFANNTNLAAVTLGKGVETIGDYAFTKSKLVDVIIPGNVRSIGERTFAEIATLQNVSLNEGIEKVGGYAFYQTSIKDIKIPKSVETIGQNAFASCSNLSNLAIADGSKPITLGSDLISGSSVKEIYLGRSYTGERAFQSTGINALTVGNEVTQIPESAYASSSSLKSVDFGTRLKAIPDNAFKNCALTEVVIPKNITTIGKNAFQSNKLTNVIIGCGASEIGANAFANNNNIATINVTAKNPPVATDDVFTTQNAQLNVLKNSREAYENAPCWYQFEGLDLVPVSAFKILGEEVPYNASALATSSPTTPKQIQFSVSSMEPANASLKEYIFWSSSNPEVATVDNNGLVTFTGATEGTADITAHTLYADVAATMTVTANGEIQTGIDDIINDNPAGINRPNDIYTLQGVCLKRNASKEDIDALAPGIYIIAGKKVLVK